MAIYSLSGCKGSGKDLSGKMINYMLSVEYPEFSDFEERGKNNVELRFPRFENKKFADKLKDMTCLLIGCTREQLEDREFKEKSLGDEWKRYNPNWISKDSLKEQLSAVDVTIEDLVRLGKYEPVGEKGDYYRSTTFDTVMTPRKIMQLIGTECGRDIIHPNIWVNSLFSEYKANLICECNGDVVPCDSPNKCPKEKIYPNWLITDLRFENEAKAVKDRGGIIIRINRPDINDSELQKHRSETALDDYDGFDYVIENDSNIEDLYNKVREVLIKESLI